MQISELTLENYKAFASEANFSIRPITLFFGYNSAGKSAALRFLKLLADSASGDCPAPINLASEAARGSDFKGLLSKYRESPRIEFSLNFGELEAEYTILHMPEHKTHIIQKLAVTFKADTRSAWLDWNPYGLAFESSQDAYAFGDKNGEILDAKVEFDGLVPVSYSEELAVVLDPLAECLKDFSRNFVALAPDCIVPGRYHTETTPIKKISPRGEGIVSILQTAQDEVLEDISAWFKKATGYSFQRNEITIGNRSGHRFTLHPNGNSAIDIDVIDTGEGMGQVLPVVSLLSLVKHGSIGPHPVISLEHPELHLHPDAHVCLADLFCDAITKNKNCKILVETHSENLLLGLQLAIARGDMQPNDVAVHWVRGTENGAIAELVEFDDDARPRQNNWPIDVFRKNSKLARELFEARKAKES